MEKAIRNRVIPLHRQNLKQGMDVLPFRNSHQNAVVVFTLVKYFRIIEIKIYDLYLRMILPQLIPQKIHIMTPVTFYQHQFFAIQILYRQPVLFRQPVMNGHRTADWLPGDFQSRALPQTEHGLIKNTGHHIDVLSQICKDLSGIFRGVVKRNQLKFDARTIILQLWPQIHQHLSRSHRRSSDTDDLFILLHGISRPRHRILAILDDIFCVLFQRFSRLCDLQSTMCADKKLQIQILFQKIDLFNDRRRGNVQFLCGLVKAAALGHA